MKNDIRANSATVISAHWATENLSRPKKWNWDTRAELHLKKRKRKKKDKKKVQAGNDLPQNSLRVRKKPPMNEVKGV